MEKKNFRPDKIMMYFRAEWKVLALITVSGLIYNLGLMAGPWFEGKMAGCLMQILTGSMISVVICMAAFVWMKKHPGNADFRVLYLISLNLEEFFAAHKSHHP